MLGSLLYYVAFTFLAYIYPSHTTFHALQSPEKLDKQLEIWTVIGIYTILRHIIDTLLGWIPGYDIATIALLAWCVAPQTQGASWIYQRFVRGWSAQHQTQIDTLANTFKTRAGTEVSKWANRLFVKIGEAFTQYHTPPADGTLQSKVSYPFLLLGKVMPSLLTINTGAESTSSNNASSANPPFETPFPTTGYVSSAYNWLSTPATGTEARPEIITSSPETTKATNEAILDNLMLEEVEYPDDFEEYDVISVSSD